MHFQCEERLSSTTIWAEFANAYHLQIWRTAHHFSPWYLMTSRQTADSCVGAWQIFEAKGESKRFGSRGLHDWKKPLLMISHYETTSEVSSESTATDEVKLKPEQ